MSLIKLYTVSEKSPTLWIVTWKVYQILIIFGTNIPETTSQTASEVPTSPNVCLCTTQLTTLLQCFDTVGSSDL